MKSSKTSDKWWFIRFAVSCWHNIVPTFSVWLLNWLVWWISQVVVEVPSLITVTKVRSEVSFCLYFLYWNLHYASRVHISIPWEDLIAEIQAVTMDHFKWTHSDASPHYDMESRFDANIVVLQQGRYLLVLILLSSFSQQITN